MQSTKFTILSTALLILVGCAGSPLQLSKMSSSEIQSVKAEKLCYAYALYKKYHESVPTIDNEVARRGLTCEKKVERLVSNCTPLAIIESIESEPARRSVSGTRYIETGTSTYITVKNSSNKKKNFRLYWQNTLSSTLTIAPGATTKYNIFTGKSVSIFNAVVGMAQGTNGEAARLTDCVTAR